MDEAGLPAPEYETVAFMLKGSIRLVIANADKVAEDNGKLNGKLNSAQIAVLTFISQHEGLLAKAISEQMNIPVDTLNKHLGKLVKEKEIEHRGSRKAGGYYLAANGKKIWQ